MSSAFLPFCEKMVFFIKISFIWAPLAPFPFGMMPFGPLFVAKSFFSFHRFRQFMQALRFIMNTTFFLGKDKPEVMFVSEKPRISPFKRRPRDEGPFAGDAKTNIKTNMEAAVEGQMENQPFSLRAKAFVQSLPWEVFIFAVTGFLMARSQILGSLYPFGPAFLAAISVSHPRQALGYLLPVALGLFTVMSGQDLIIYGTAYALVALIFLFYHVDEKRQWLVVPALVFAAIALSKGLAGALFGFDNYQLLVGLFEGIFAAGLSLVFLVVFGALKRLALSHSFTTEETICLFILLMGVVGGLADWQIFGISLQDIISRFFIMAVAYLGGGGAGAAAGALIGIVPSLSAVIAPTAIATYSFSGLLGGVFANFGRLGTIMGFFLGNLILALYLYSGVQISASLSASAAAALLFFVLPRGLYRSLRQTFSGAHIKTAREDKSERMLRLSMRRIRNASWVFQDLSKSLAEMNESKSEENKDSSKIVLNYLARQLCADCSMKEICWELDYPQTYHGVLRLFKTVEDKGHAVAKDVPENFKKRCPHIKELLAVINCLYEMYARSNYWQAQRESSRGLLARQMAGVSDVLNGIAKEIGNFNSEREILERELAPALVKSGLDVEAAGVSAMNEKTVDVWVSYGDCPGELFCRRILEEETSRLMGHNYAVHEIQCDGGLCRNRCRYRMLLKKARKLNIGKAQLAKNTKGICGDCSGTLLLDEGREMLMVSDGMGIGQQAAAESGAALSLVSRLLEAGFCEDTTIDTVNGALALRADAESFVTLDICMVDLYSGQTEFIKNGGAPSFIKSGDSVRIVKSAALPVGMLNSIKREKIVDQVERGDFIVMASDGLLDMHNEADAQLVKRIIEQAPALSAQALAEYLLEKAVAVSGGKLRDDITVLVAEVA